MHNKDSHVCKLNKALYGLKQAPRVWYERIDNYLKKPRLIKINADSNFYFKVVNNQPLILILYLDDLFLTREEKQIDKCKMGLTTKFKMNDLSSLHYFLDLEVWQNLGEMLLSQGKYIVDVLKRFGMMDC